MIGTQINCLKGNNYAFVDVETTGTSATYGQIIEIAVVRVEDGVVTKTYQTLLQPARSLSPTITKITGITEGDLNGQPLFEDVAIEIKELLDDAIFVAHFARFDYGFVKTEFKRLGIDWNAKTLCTVKLSKFLYPDQSSHSLENIIHFHKIKVNNRHRAADDALAMLDFVRAAEKEHDVAEAIKHAMSSYLLPPNIEPEIVKNLPHKPGVYLFYDANDTLLYIGKSVDIKNRVRSHFSQAHISGKERSITSAVTFIDCIETSGELTALLKESALIKELAPIYNRRLRSRNNLAVFKSNKNSSGYKTASIFYQPTLDIVDIKNIEGIFRTVTAGKVVVNKCIDEFQLCPKLLEMEKGKGACFQYQLGKCKGACCGKESPEEYNKRFDEAFKIMRIKSWPFAGSVTVPEDPEAIEGTAFVIDQWRILKQIDYTEQGYSEKEINASFDYDSYRILSKHLLKNVR